MKPRFSRLLPSVSTVIAFSMLAAVSSATAQTSGTWISNASGNWSDASRWSEGVVASGAGSLADFSLLDITADHVVTIDTPVTIGTLKTQDFPTISNSWVFDGPGPITLDNGLLQPVLHIMNRFPTISAPLAGNNGFQKISAGAVTLSGDNSGLSGVMNLPEVTGTNSAGVVLASEKAIGGIKTINVGGTATTGQYLGISGGITLGADVTINLNSQGGNAAPDGALRSLGGATAVNTINGPINITSGGVRIANNGSGLLVLNGPITGGANGVTFRFATNQGVHVTNPANAWTGTTIHSQGDLYFHPGALPASSPLIIGASAAGTVMMSGTMTRALGTNAGQVRLGGAETSVSGRALGYSAKGGDLTLNFGGAGAELFFNNFTSNTTGTPTTINTNTLVLNGSLADGKITLVNPVNLNGAARTLQVSANVAQLDGAVNGGAFALNKTGAGTLLLNRAHNWQGNLVIAAGSNTNAGYVRLTVPEGLGPIGQAKDIFTNGSNCGTSVLELVGGITIPANKSLKMAGKGYVRTDTGVLGQQHSLSNVSGDNVWEGNCLIAISGGSYALLSSSGTLTLGANPTTASVVRNDVTGSTRELVLHGGGNYVINSLIANNGTGKITITKAGSGQLAITRGDNDFDTVPNLRHGTTTVTNLTDGGSPSSLGVAASYNLGGTLRYTGAGESSNRVLGLLQTGGTIEANGGGALQLTSPTMTHQTGIGGTVAVPFALGATELVMNDVSSIAVGQTVTGTGIEVGTTVAAVDRDTRKITLSLPTNAATTGNGVAITFGGAHNIDRTLTLGGSNTGDNKFSATLSNPGGTGKLGLTKTGPGKWIVNGTNHSYSGPTLLQEGTLAFDGGYSPNTVLTMNPAATLSVANLEFTANAQTGLAIDIPGNLAIDGPVTIALAQAAPVGTFEVLKYASATGLNNLATEYRVSSVVPGATSTSVTIGAGTDLTWTGGFDGYWDVKTTQNFKSATNPADVFYQGDSVRFDDSGILEMITLDGTLRPAAMVVDSSLVNYAFSGTGILAGPFALTKKGTSTLSLGGSHSFNGGITIEGGILRPGGNQSLGGNGQKINVLEGAALDTGGVMNANRDYEVTLRGNGPDGTGAVVNTGGGHNNGFRSLTLAGDASVGGIGRWDVRPITAGTTVVDLAGFNLTKSGTNWVSFVDGSMTSAGNVFVNEGTLTLTRMEISGEGAITVKDPGLLQFENYTSGTLNKKIVLENDGRMRLTGSNLTLPGEIELKTSGKVDVADTRVLTLAGTVTGSGKLVKSLETGALIVTADNTYNGGTDILGGRLQIGAQTTTGSIGSGAVLNDGTLHFNRLDSITFDRDISGLGSITVGQLNGGAFDSVVTLTGANTFEGGILVNSGGLKIQNAGALGSGPKTVTLTNGTAGRPQFYLDGSAGNITLRSDIAFVTSSTIMETPAIGNLAGENVIEGPITMTSGGGSTAVSAVAGKLTLNGQISANVADRYLLLGGTAGTGVVNGLITNGTNPVGVTKENGNTWTLNGNNNYTGSTAINGGTLVINGNQSAAVGLVTVNAGATLAGTGTLGGNISALVGSTVAPGVSVGTLSTGAAASIAGTLAVDVSDASSDLLQVSGSLDLMPGAALQVNFSGVPTKPAYVIATYGVLGGSFATVSGIPSGYGVEYNYNGENKIALVPMTGSAYVAWEKANGIEGAGAAVDSDGDGIANGIEFVLGGDPSGPNSASNSLMPGVSVDATHLRFVFRRTDASAAFSPQVEYGSALAGWSVAQDGVDGVVVTVEDDAVAAGIDRVTVLIPRALAAPGTRLFARLKVVAE